MNAKTEESVSLQPRKKPLQKRSRERVESILAACAALLEEIGPDGVNTNTIAERAGIPVSSVYQYFPNKHAVQMELMIRMLREIDQASMRLLGDLTPDTRWEEISDRVIRIHAKVSEQVPGCFPLWLTLQAHPQRFQNTSAHLVGEMKTLTRLLEAYCQLHLPGKYTAEDIHFMLQVVIDAIMPILGTATRQEGTDKERYLEAAIRVTRGYLGSYLDTT